MSDSAPAQGIPDTLGAFRKTAGALGRLAETELELSGSLLLRAALLGCIAVASLAASIGVATAGIVALLSYAGLGWPVAALVTLVILLLLTALCLYACRKTLRASSMPATRRQIRALLPADEGTSP